MRQIYKVEITYKTDEPFAAQEKDVFSFSTETAARDFARRQTKKPDVAKASYIGAA